MSLLNQNWFVESSLGLAFVCLIGAAWSAYTTVQQLRQDRDEVTHTRAIIDTAQEVFNQVRFAEGGRRGYLLTHHTNYLETYEQGVSQTRSQLATLHQLVQSKVETHSTVNQLDPLIASRFATLKQSILVFQTSPERTTFQAALTDQGRLEQQAVWDQIAVLKQTEFQALNVQRARTDKTIARLEILEAITGVSSLLLLACAYCILKQEIIQRQKVAAEMRRINQDLQRSNQDLEGFAFIASHDLQEPLRVIQTYAKQLLTANPQSADRPMLERMIERTTQMRSLIRDLLVYARIGIDLPPPTLSDCNLLLDTVLSNLEVLIAQTQTQVIVGQLPTLYLHTSEWIELLQNLIENAIQFRRSLPPVIQIRAQSSDSKTWLFSIQDNGMGIQAEQLDSVFDRFYRTRNIGTGLGLSICRKIIERQGGKIWAESTPNQGTTIYFSVSQSLS